jgi:hypothetical protein
MTNLADPTMDVPIQLQPGGKVLNIGSGGTLNIDDGAILSYAGQQVNNGARNVTLTPAAGTANQSLVTLQLKDAAGNAIAVVTPIDVWLSDAATGIGLTGTTASGAVAAGASGTDLGVLTTKKAITSLTDATGKYILAITDTAKTGFFVCAAVGSKIYVSAALVAGNYG